MTKENKSLKNKISSRRKFFKTAAKAELLLQRQLQCQTLQEQTVIQH